MSAQFLVQLFHENSSSRCVLVVLSCDWSPGGSAAIIRFEINK